MNSHDEFQGIVLSVTEGGGIAIKPGEEDIVIVEEHFRGGRPPGIDIVDGKGGGIGIKVQDLGKGCVPSLGAALSARFHGLALTGVEGEGVYCGNAGAPCQECFGEKRGGGGIEGDAAMDVAVFRESVFIDEEDGLFDGFPAAAVAELSVESHGEHVLFKKHGESRFRVTIGIGASVAAGIFPSESLIGIKSGVFEQGFAGGAFPFPDSAADATQREFSEFTAHDPFKAVMRKFQAAGQSGGGKAVWLDLKGGVSGLDEQGEATAWKRRKHRIGRRFRERQREKESIVSGKAVKGFDIGGTARGKIYEFECGAAVGVFRGDFGICRGQRHGFGVPDDIIATWSVAGHDAGFAVAVSGVLQVVDASFGAVDLPAGGVGNRKDEIESILILRWGINIQADAVWEEVPCPAQGFD